MWCPGHVETRSTHEYVDFVVRAVFCVQASLVYRGDLTEDVLYVGLDKSFEVTIPGSKPSAAEGS